MKAGLRDYSICASAVILLGAILLVPITAMRLLFSMLCMHCIALGCVFQAYGSGAMVTLSASIWHIRCLASAAICSSRVSLRLTFLNHTQVCFYMLQRPPRAASCLRQLPPALKEAFPECLSLSLAVGCRFDLN